MPEFTAINKDGEVKVEQSPDAEPNGGPVQNLKEESEDETSGVPDAAVDAGKNTKAKSNGKTPATPRKRGRKPATEKATSEDDDDEESPTKKARGGGPKEKAAKAGGSEKGKKPGSRAMPTSYENASPEDRMLLRMKDEEGKPWGEIRAAWEEMTGEKVGGSTLSGRYARIKANFVVFNPDDEARLVQFKKEIESKFENEKWQQVAKAIEDAGGNKYPPAAVQKKFKELNKKMSGLAIESENGFEES
ncbi:hypothetical protein FQN52_007336 [Onygenales sp. PD_12]|nr:hypothetical protein FQN52_007336 [Onygenales sp. PD_12]KAK2802032.1 hypothetical protein FQN51_004942 [Onygenales sp. PD_10]